MRKKYDPNILCVRSVDCGDGEAWIRVQPAKRARRRVGHPIIGRGPVLPHRPGNAEAYANLAGILHFAGEPERVAGLIKKAKRLNPFYPFYFTLYVGQAYFTLHRFEEAAATIARAVAHNPQSLPSHFYLAAIYGQLGEAALAREALAEIRRINPDFSIAQARTIAAYKRADDLNLLIDGLRKAGFPE